MTNPGRALLDAIYADPANDEARDIYADWLSERGDPRGEFIALQMARHRSESKELRHQEEKRERQLLAHNVTAWLGAIAPIVSRTQAPRFERGFLYSVALEVDRNVVQTPFDPALAKERVFATVGELYGECRDFIAAAPHVRRIEPYRIWAGRRDFPGPRRLDIWMNLFAANDRLEHIGIDHSTLRRSDGRNVVRILLPYARYVVPFFLEPLRNVDGTNWTIELVSDEPTSDSDAPIVDEFRTLPGYDVQLVVTE